jgi:hypothetical protein
VADRIPAHMPYEEVPIVTPLKRVVTIRLTEVGEDVWDTSIVYMKQTRRVGKYQGKDRAMEAARKMAEAVGDAPTESIARTVRKRKTGGIP